MAKIIQIAAEIWIIFLMNGSRKAVNFTEALTCENFLQHNFIHLKFYINLMRLHHYIFSGGFYLLVYFFYLLLIPVDRSVK
jgi:hypothetical protein